MVGKRACIGIGGFGGVNRLVGDVWDGGSSRGASVWVEQPNVSQS